MQSVLPTTKQLDNAKTICRALSGFIPEEPSDVRVTTSKCKSGKGSNTVMRILFQNHGVELAASFYKPKDSGNELLAEVRIHIQVLRCFFRRQTVSVAYEELKEALNGTGVLTILGPDFLEFMRSEMDDDLRKLMDSSDDNGEQGFLRVAA